MVDDLNNIIYLKNENISEAELDKEICLYDPKTFKYINLNLTGSSIWRLIDKEIEFNALVDKIYELYDVNYDTCYIQLKEFLSEMESIGIVYKK